MRPSVKRMYDVAVLATFVAVFAFIFLVLYVLERL